MRLLALFACLAFAAAPARGQRLEPLAGPAAVRDSAAPPAPPAATPAFRSLDVASVSVLSAFGTGVVGLLAGRQADHRRCLEDHPHRFDFIVRECSTDFHRSANDGWYLGTALGATVGAFFASAPSSGCPQRSVHSRALRAAAGAALGAAPGLVIRSVARSLVHSGDGLAARDRRDAAVFISSAVTPVAQGLTAAALLGHCAG